MRALCLVLVVGCAGCAAAEAMPAATPAAAPSAAAPVVPAATLGFFPGESMTFDVGLRGVTGAEAELAVGQPGEIEGHRAIVVTSKATTSGAVALVMHLTDEATTVIDLDTGLPLQLDTVVEYNDKRSTAHATFGAKFADVEWSRPDDATPHHQHIAFGSTGVLDSHSAMGTIRDWKPAPGATRTVWVIGGRRLWRVDVAFAGLETIESALGSRRALKFEGKAFRARPNLTAASATAERSFTVWLTDDADRVPLKLTAHTELGEVTMALTDYQRP